MVKVKEDLAGMVFGRLTVLEQAEDYINVKSGQHYARWLCECSCKERNKIIAHGSSLKNKRTQSCGCLRNNNIKNSCFRGNKFNLNDEYGVLFETNTGKEVRFDLENADKILQYTWWEDEYGYPAAKVNGKTIRMHVLLGYKWCDHIDRNKKNNRISNLRSCTPKENTRNRTKQKGCSSKYIGVCKDKNRWRAYIAVDGEKQSLGSYDTEEDALISRLKAEKEYFKEFAPQKYLFENYNI